MGGSAYGPDTLPFIVRGPLLHIVDRYVKGTRSELADLLHLRSAAERERAETRGYPEVELSIDY